MKNTGYRVPAQNPDVMAKMRRTSLENNGFECALSHSSGLRETFKETSYKKIWN